ncbi:Rossmann-like and DUF2520 domain-containing protein [Ancrocorticia populi]|uniref:Oxidoreductase n=1 Tax=Ancrocorticia populi TaxID=2175228 RepID=A0A2V1K947_9ACTO|nr:DUF2520 domain-containing protein [Ancrocorticia populi]PWF25976.1 oxidoreductase [Ancrocorticia populi]
MSQSATRPGRLKIGVISAGKVGATIAAALRAVGHTITGAYAHSEASIDRLETMLPGVPAMEVEEIAAASEMILLAVPDDELGPLVAGMAKLDLWKRGHLAVHVAGRYGTGVLDPAAEAGAIPLAAHPAMTFTGTSLDLKRLIDCPFGITASPMFLPIGQALVEEIGGRAVPIEEEDRGLYHAAICHGANHAVTLVNQAMRMLETLGIEDPGAYLAPLVHASIDGALRSGEKLLTGPVVRGDAGTVAEHLQAIDALAATTDATDIPPVYRALAEATADRAHTRRVLTDAQRDAVTGALGTKKK